VKPAIAAVFFAALTLSAAHAAACTPWTTRPLDVEAGSSLFPQGTAVSGIRTDRAVVWVRASKSVPLSVRASSGPGCDEFLSKPVRPRGGRDRTARISVDGLVAGTWYRYRVEAAGKRVRASPWAWFRTAPATGTGFDLVYTADIGPRAKWRGFVVDQMATEDADLLLFLGDWPYADVHPKALTALDFRRKYREHRAIPLFRRMLAARGLEAVWDDHEVKNDWDGKDAVEEAERVEAGMRAWRDFFITSAAPRGEIYRRVRWGDVDIFLLDTRSHRSANSARDNARKTMLGKQQLRWLLAGLQESDAVFKVVCTSVPLDYGTTRKDQWPAFSTERDKLLAHIENNAIEGVVFVTADQHWFAAHHLPGGHKQFQAGPLSQFLRTPGVGVSPAVRVQAEELNYAVLRYSPSPPQLTVIGKGTGGKEIYREVVSPGRGRLSVAPPHPWALWQTHGPHTFFGTGPLEALSAPAGRYELRFAPASPDFPVPADAIFELGAGGEHRASWVTTMRPRVWDAFDGGLEQWVVVDQGEKDRTSQWRVRSGVLAERGNCHDRDDEPLDLPKNGTMLIRPDAALDQGSVAVRAAAYDLDGFGLVYHYRDANNYHRAAFHPERGFVRLVQVRGGVATALAIKTEVELPRRWWTTYAVQRVGDEHRVYVSGKLVLSATQKASGGATGLYSWGMKDVRFDDFAVVDAATGR
jgi:alkaline phosphatase D